MRLRRSFTFGLAMIGVGSFAAMGIVSGLDGNVVMRSVLCRRRRKGSLRAKPIARLLAAVEIFRCR
jgi:hypothetical protein